jgi:hypothetical protein
MEFREWLASNVVNLLSTFGIVGSFFITARSFRSEAKTRRIANLLSITANHREVWKVFVNDKSLTRVLAAKADTSKQPITESEKAFVTLVITHISSVYYAMNDQLVVNLDGLRRDIVQFLSLPIPRAVWENIKVLQNDDFAAFVESCRNWK